MSLIDYIVLGITAVSYLLGLFLSYCEKRGKISILADTGNAGFIGTFDNNSLASANAVQTAKPMMYQAGVSSSSPYMDEEIL